MDLRTEWRVYRTPERLFAVLANKFSCGRPSNEPGSPECDQKIRTKRESVKTARDRDENGIRVDRATGAILFESEAGNERTVPEREFDGIYGFDREESRREKRSVR